MRPRSFLQTIFLLLLAAGQPWFSAAGKFPYEPIAQVDLSAYVGLWYQSYASQSVIWTFELGGNCVTAEYFTTDKPRTIRVKNVVRPFGDFSGFGGDKDDYDSYDKHKGKSGGGSWFTDIFKYCLTLVVNGYASISPEIDGQAYVELQPGPIPLGIGTPDLDDVMYQAPGNYWIIELGPIMDGQYRYAVVTNDLQTQLYVLVRDVDEFEAVYEDGVLKRLKSFGFTTPTNKPIKTNQRNCGYKGQKDDGSKDYYDDHYYDDYYYDDHH